MCVCVESRYTYGHVSWSEDYYFPMLVAYVPTLVAKSCKNQGSEENLLEIRRGSACADTLHAPVQCMSILVITRCFQNLLQCPQ